MNNNRITIESYENSLDKYIEKTPSTVSGEFQKWIDLTLSCISPESTILELGTGLGRDADYIENLGYNIHRSDIVDVFIEYNKRNNKSIVKYDVLKITHTEKFDMIFANAVLLHLSKEQFSIALKNIHKALCENGILSFSMKCGIGEEITEEKVKNPRFFCYRQIDDLSQELINHDFSILNIDYADSEKWIHCICRKQ